MRDPVRPGAGYEVRWTAYREAESSALTKRLTAGRGEGGVLGGGHGCVRARCGPRPVPG